MPRPLIIAHRGASAYRPEHTRAAYERAVADGADLIEPDVCMTRDGVPIVRHENNIAETTDVADHPGFAARHTEKWIDGERQSGWFTEDFTLAELKTLRARERLPALRPTSAACDGYEPVLTLAEVVDLAAMLSRSSGRTIGIVPEIKHSSYFASIGLPVEDAFIRVVAAHDRAAPLIVQSFEIDNLRALRARMGDWPNLRLMQLCESGARQPADVVLRGGDLTYADMMTRAGLAAMAGYADIVAPAKAAIIPVDATGGLGAPTALVRDAHAAGLAVMPWTFRPENNFLPPMLREGTVEAHRAEAGAMAELRAFVAAGVDGFFTDDPGLARALLDG